MSESLRNFEKQELITGAKEKLTTTPVEYDQVVQNMSLNVRTMRSGGPSQESLRSSRATALTQIFKEETRSHVSKAFSEDIFFSKIEKTFRKGT